MLGWAVFLAACVAAPAPIPEAPLSFQVKLVENIFCKGMAGECQNVTSWEETHRLQMEAKAREERLRLEEERRIAADEARAEAARREAEERRSQNSIGTQYPGGSVVSSVAVGAERKEGSEIKLGGEFGGPHNGSRHAAYYPNGIPANSASLGIVPSPEPVPENVPTPAIIWQTPNRYPHQRSEFHLELPRVEGDTENDGDFQAKAASVANVQTAVPHVQSEITSVANIQAAAAIRQPNNGSDELHLDFNPSPNLKASREPVKSRHVAEVPHYVGFETVDANWSPDNPGVPLFERIPRKSEECDHRFSYKCEKKAAEPTEPTEDATLDPTEEGSGNSHARLAARHSSHLLQLPAAPKLLRGTPATHHITTTPSILHHAPRHPVPPHAHLVVAPATKHQEETPAQLSKLPDPATLIAKDTPEFDGEPDIEYEA